MLFDSDWALARYGSTDKGCPSVHDLRRQAKFGEHRTKDDRMVSAVPAEI